MMEREERKNSDLPEGWETEPFVDTLDDFKAERTKQIQANAYLTDGKYPIVDQGQELIAGWSNDESAIIKDGLPLIIFGDHTRIFKYVDFPFAIGADGTKLIKPRNRFNALYFYYYLLSLNIPSKGYSRHYKTLKEKDISYPPFPEQKKISAVLYKIQKAIETRESIIKTTQELKKSTMQHLFTHGLHGEKTKQTEIGEIPEGWKVEKIGTYCNKPTYGFTASAVNEDVGPKFLRITDITENGVNWQTVPYCNCSEEEFKQYELKQDDILFARIGATTGKSYIIKNPPNAIYASYLIRLRTQESIDPNYLYYFLNSESYWHQISANKANNLKGGVNASILSSLLFPLPHRKSEQKEIADILDVIDRKIIFHNSRKTILQDLFNSMLNKLMSGEIRANDYNAI